MFSCVPKFVIWGTFWGRPSIFVAIFCSLSTFFFSGFKPCELVLSTASCGKDFHSVTTCCVNRHPTVCFACSFHLMPLVLVMFFYNFHGWIFTEAFPVMLLVENKYTTVYSHPKEWRNVSVLSRQRHEYISFMCLLGCFTKVCEHNAAVRGCLVCFGFFLMSVTKNVWSLYTCWGNSLFLHCGLHVLHSGRRPQQKPILSRWHFALRHLLPTKPLQTQALRLQWIWSRTAHTHMLNFNPHILKRLLKRALLHICC